MSLYQLKWDEVNTRWSLNTGEEINCYFMTLDKFRDKQIDNLLI